ncbi:unnamed protein product [Hermetia illucens]|uniref:Sodium/calcium exchanger membrane region domain-containing protein n=1 Tax=Hermetia illucens TaxID=343691 RepID=A0A7R8UMM5_HERIL|nr:unnamed protein product [Hermetia illucens]
MFTILSGPFFIITVSRMITWKFFGVSIYVYWLIPAIVVIVLVYFFSRTDTPPVYHIGFACFSVIVSLILVRIVALEVLYVIYTVGTASQMSPTLINVTLQAWEGGIGSLIANVILAYRGYPRMSFAACYGGPLFSILF